MFSEKVFEDILVKYPELIEERLKFIGRQEKYYGKRIDILFEDRFNEKLIVELKKDNLDRNALSQVLEYEGYILSEKDPSARVMIIANRIPLNLKKAMDHHGIEYKEITLNHILQFLEKSDQEILTLILSQHQEDFKISTPKSSQISISDSMASKLDEIIKEGGTWEEMIKKAEAESQIRNGHIKYTKGVINSHIRYRTVTQKNPNYLNDYFVTEKGIYPKFKYKTQPIQTSNQQQKEPKMSSPKSSLKAYKNSMASNLDEIIKEGGTWEEMIAKAEDESQKRHGNIKYTKGVINSHIRYRTVTQNNPNYLINYLITEKGIFPKSKNK